MKNVIVAIVTVVIVALLILVVIATPPCPDGQVRIRDWLGWPACVEGHY